jgi:hypothetical protein
MRQATPILSLDLAKIGTLRIFAKSRGETLIRSIGVACPMYMVWRDAVLRQYNMVHGDHIALLWYSNP